MENPLNFASGEDLYEKSLREDQEFDIKPDFFLDEHERTTPVWKKIKAHFEEKMVILREENDYRSSELETAHRRGRIFAIKEILALGEDPPEPEFEDDEEFEDPGNG